MAYALLSLIQILEQQDDLTLDIKPQIESLIEKAYFLRDCVENSSIYNSSENKDLESRIRDAAYDAEDVIESYIMDRAASAYDAKDVTGVMENFDSIKEELLKIVDEKKMLFPAPLAVGLGTRSSEPNSSGMNIVVGFDREFSHLKDQLIEEEMQSPLRIIPIVGIGGSGKTTMAQKLFNHVSITNQFDALGWVTISQQFNLKRNLLDLLRSLRTFNNQMHSENDDELGERVRNTLKGMRYLIVVDDIWDMDAWGKIRSLFPDEENGSRVILTTREPTVADYAKSLSDPHQMRLLSDEESWALLGRKVFGRESCPPEWVETGENIARYCRGHPLTLTMMAGHLSASEKTLAIWKRVEQRQLDLVENDHRESCEIQDDPSMDGVVNLFIKDGCELLKLITGPKPELQIIPIVGMDGSGKTTLARLLYNRSILVKHFDFHAWITDSQEAEVLAPLRTLLDSIRKKKNTKEVPRAEENDLAVKIHKTLHKRRYLIVVDDIKDTYTWDMLRKFFADEGTGSRIILTAKEWNIKDYDGLKPLHLNSYWEFLLHKVFEQDGCSSELENPQMKVSGLIPTSEKMRVFWEIFGKNQMSGKSKRNSQFDLISMSYDHLPCHLKPCFLYMGAFPEDYEIKASKIVKLWIGEGFVKQMACESLEDTAEMYLKRLVDRNLLLVSRRDPNGKMETIRIHDIFWKFCYEKAFEENFMWFKNSEGQNNPEDEEKVRRVSVNSLSQDSDWMGLDSARSFLCSGPVLQEMADVFQRLRLLRVLDVLQFVCANFPEEMLELLNLRYLAFTCFAAIPSSISTFRKLQTLVIPGASSIPSTLFEMTQLRHIKCKQARTWSFSEENGENCGVVQACLQTLSNVPSSLVSEEFLKKFPNLWKLGIFYDGLGHNFIDLSYLYRLENLKCTSYRSPAATRNFLSHLLFPFNLRKLTLRSCVICSDDVYGIRCLPNLEQLKLQKCDFTANEWNPTEGEFQRLKVLHMEDLNLVHMEAYSEHFPCLERLIIRGCRSMQEIPPGIGEIPTLQIIEVDDCGSSLVDSALSILEEQRSFGNDVIRVSTRNTRAI